MIRPVKLAKINLTMQTGTILRWLKREGEEVNQDDPLAEVETDKAVNTVVSFYSGILKKILVPEGQEVPVDTLIAYIGAPEDVVPEEPVEATGDGGGEDAVSEPSHGEVAASVADRGGLAEVRLNASPLARRLARELGVDLSAVAGTGPQGRIGREDVLAAAKGGGSEAPAAATTAALSGPEGLSGQRVALSSLKKTTAELMARSHSEAPHIHLERTVVVAALESLRERLNAGGRDQRRYTLTDLLVKAVSRALATNPLLNASFRDGGVTMFSELNIGVAASTPRGLVVPVIRDCGGLSLERIRARRVELLSRAREGRQTAEDLQGGTFTITNLGMFGVDSFRPILNPGQSAILAVGAVRAAAVVEPAGGVVSRPVMNLCLGCDHRVVDGVEAARFLCDLTGALEQPELLAGDD